MRTLILGAGATGALLGATLLDAGRDVTFLVRPRTAERLRGEGLHIRRADGSERLLHPAVVTAEEVTEPVDLVVVGVRGAALATAVEDVRPAVGPTTRIVPLLNGLAHLDVLAGAFGPDAVVGATARLGATLLPDGTVVELLRGITLELPTTGPGAAAVRDEFAVDGVTVTAVEDVRGAMWTKWCFIAATSVVSILTGAVVGEAAATPGGPELAVVVVDEIAAVAAAEDRVGDVRRDALLAVLTDPASRFTPSLARELWAGRPVEVEVLVEFAGVARRHGLPTPLLDAAVVRARVAERART